MSRASQAYQWRRQVASYFVGVSKPLTTALASFSLGMAWAERCRLRSVAEALPHLGKPDTVERRLQRFLANTHLDWQSCCVAWTRWVVDRLDHRGSMVLLVDETSLRDKMKVMVVAVAYRGRAIPLSWWCYRNDDWPMGQVELVTTLLGWVRDALHDSKQPPSDVLVEADRCIGTSPTLLRAIEEMGFYYLMRVQRTVKLRLETGEEIAFGDTLTKPGKRWSGRVHAFKAHGWLPCWAVSGWGKSHEQPWLLLTNHPQAGPRWYALRMWEELSFRDLKSSGWEWKRSRVYKPEHANRLWLLMTMAYGWVLTVGTQVIQNPKRRKLMCRGKKWRYSVFQLGLRWKTRVMALGTPMIANLNLIPHFPQRPKCVVH